MGDLLDAIIEFLEKIGTKLETWADKISGALFKASMRIGGLILGNRVSHIFLIKILLKPILYLIGLGLWVQLIKDTWIRLVVSIVGFVLIMILFPPFTFLLIISWLILRAYFLGY
jgi:hypothetical protein